jgi:hypothetical protein
MQRQSHEARCALIDQLREWELRVIIDADVILAESFSSCAEAFVRAEAWKRRMLGDGWYARQPAMREQSA